MCARFCYKLVHLDICLTYWKIFEMGLLQFVNVLGLQSCAMANWMLRLYANRSYFYENKYARLSTPVQQHRGRYFALFSHYFQQILEPTKLACLRFVSKSHVFYTWLCMSTAIRICFSDITNLCMTCKESFN